MAKVSKLAKAKKLINHITRRHNRCLRCGRPRGYIRMAGLCRLCFRELAHRGELPGITKASW